jgi:hypothetical protein
LRAHVPSGKRSKFIAEILAKKLQTNNTVLQQAAEKANRLRSVSKDMKDWEALNEYAD